MLSCPQPKTVQSCVFLFVSKLPENLQPNSLSKCCNLLRSGHSKYLFFFALLYFLLGFSAIKSSLKLSDRVRKAVTRSRLFSLLDLSIPLHPALNSSLGAARPWWPPPLSLHPTSRGRFLSYRLIPQLRHQ